MDGFLERDAWKASLHGHELRLHDTASQHAEHVEAVVPSDRYPGVERPLRARARVYAQR